MADDKKAKVKKKIKKEVREGIAHVCATFNNTIITITDVQGNVLVWASAASCGYRGSRKSTPFAGGEAAYKAAVNATALYNMKNVQVKVKGPGPGRESAVRSFHAAGLTVNSITDATTTPHNGCKPKKKRRI